MPLGPRGDRAVGPLLEMAHPREGRAGETVVPARALGGGDLRRDPTGSAGPGAAPPGVRARNGEGAAVAVTADEVVAAGALAAAGTPLVTAQPLRTTPEANARSSVERERGIRIAPHILKRRWL